MAKCATFQWPLQWHHNELNGCSNHQPHDCFLNCLFSRRSKKTSKLHVTGLCPGNSPVTGEFPAQKASNAEKVSIWWRHHGQISYLIAGLVHLWTIKLVITASAYVEAHNASGSIVETVRTVKLDTVFDIISLAIDDSRKFFICLYGIIYDKISIIWCLVGVITWSQSLMPTAKLYMHRPWVDREGMIHLKVRSKSPKTRFFVQKIVQANNKGASKFTDPHINAERISMSWRHHELFCIPG